MKKKWTKIADSKVRHVWRISDACMQEHGLEIADEFIYVDPTFYADSGTPICGDCGADAEYVRTEVLK